MAVGIVGIGTVLVTLVVGAVVIAALSHASRKTLIALPVVVLLLLSISSVLFGLFMPRQWAAVRSAHPEEVPQLVADLRGAEQLVRARALSEADVLSAQQAHLQQVLDTQQAAVEQQRAGIAHQIDANRAAIDRQRELIAKQMAIGIGPTFGSNRFNAAAGPQIQMESWARLALLGVPVVLLFIVGAVVVAQRKWIARHAGILIPVAGIGFLGLMAIAGMFVVHSRTGNVHESARRAEVVANLRAIGESMHAAVSESEPGPPPPPTPVSVEAGGESGEIVADGTEASGTPDMSAVTATDGAADPTSADVVAVASQPAPVELPDWIHDQWNTLNDLDRNPVVLVSEEWSTVAESERQLEQAAAAAIWHNVRQQHAELGDWVPSLDFVLQCGAIQTRFVEETTLQVGEFESPMYRSYWQVAVTPGVTDLAFSNWKESAVDTRLTWLGGGVAGMTVLFAMFAGMLRIDSATGGRYRGRMLTTAAIGVSIATGVAMLLA